ncbi:MAG TPA: helix-turn-helix domain-containing protein [Cyclobacteriaceae bacterium]|nr:helix-turn-helix domain-containing protein [Cyclobacteriaceae bacterium]
MISKIRTEKEYKLVSKTIEELLNKATRAGGFHKLTANEADMLEQLSALAENYEDNVLKLMPIQPKSLQEAVEFKMHERKWTQAQLAKNLGIGAPKLSQILSGKREPDLKFLKAVHKKLKIDADFILSHV